MDVRSAGPFTCPANHGSGECREVDTQKFADAMGICPTVFGVCSCRPFFCMVLFRSDLHGFCLIPHCLWASCFGRIPVSVTSCPATILTHRASQIEQFEEQAVPVYRLAVWNNSCSCSGSQLNLLWNHLDSAMSDASDRLRLLHVLHPSCALNALIQIHGVVWLFCRFCHRFAVPCPLFAMDPQRPSPKYCAS